MKTKKSMVLFVFIFIFILLTLFILSRRCTYSDMSQNEIRNAIIKAISDSVNPMVKNPMLEDISTKDIIIEKSIEIENITFVLFSINLFKTKPVGSNPIGRFVFKKGFNNKCKIESFGHGTNLNTDYLININNTTHLFLYGKNFNKEISKIIVKTNTQQYEFDITNDIYYVKDIQLDDFIEDNINYIPIEWSFYDDKNTDITKEITLEYNKEVLNLNVNIE